MHKLLERQLSKYFGGHLPDVPGIEQFINAVESAYIENEKRIRNLENILDVSTTEATAEVNNIRTAIDEANLVAIIGKNGRVTSVNKHIQKLTGRDASEFINKPVLEIEGIHQHEAIQDAITVLLSGEIWQGELSIQTKSNNIIWLNGTVTPLKDGKGSTTRFLAIFHDITARKLFEEEIISSEKKHRSVLNGIQDIIFQADKKLEYTFLNNSWTDITGYSINETLGRKLDEFFAEEDRATLSQIIAQLISNNISSGNSIFRLKSQDGICRWVDFTIKGNFQLNGNLLSYSGSIRDISETKRKEELLAKSNAFQQTLLDAAKHAIISTEPSGIVKTFNQGAIRLTGYTALEAIGRMKIQDIILPVQEITAEWNPQTMLVYQQKNKNQETEHQLLTAGSVKTDVAVSIGVINENLTEDNGFLFILNDISLRKSNEEEIRRLNTILEESPDFVSYYDMAGNMIYANKAFREVRNKNRNQATTETYPAWADLIIRRKAIPHALENGMWKGETAILDNDGNEIPVHQLINCHRDQDGVPRFISSIMHDITQRKQYEFKLLQSEKRNRDLINYSQAIIATHDLTGKILSINPAGYRLLEYSLEEMVSKNIMEFMPANLRQQFSQQYLPTFKKSKAAEGILTLLSKSGKTIHLLYKNYKVDESGEESYIIGFAQDITERLQSETELKAAKNAAEESAKAKEMFLANMSHEIRTPMNGIVGLTNLLLKSQLTEKQREYTSSVKQSAENLLVIINDILDFSKIQAGKLELNKKPFSLTTLFYNLQRSFKADAQLKQLELQINIDDNIHPTLISDEIRINQVLSNLISNAVKFTDSGRIEITAQLIEETAEACRLRISVKDTGIGIAEEKLDKIFNSFTQADSDISRQYGGTGLGLSIVKSLLDLFGSTIKVESKVGTGSIFYFEINLEKCDNLLIETENKEEEYSGQLGGVRILMAEDNKVNQLFASELLQDWGVSLDIADNGRQAVVMAENNEYDVILMDIQMPEMSGLDATKHIRTQFPNPKSEMVIIAMTANAMKGNEAIYNDAGMNDVIFKPYQAKELFQTIKRHLPDGNIKSTLKNSRIRQGDNKTTTSDIPATNEPILSYANMNVLKAFSRGKDSFILKMLNVLIESVPTSAMELQKALDNNEWTIVAKAAHKLIPNMNMIGNPQLEQEMKWIEEQAGNSSEQLNIRMIWEKSFKTLQLAINELKVAEKYYKSKATS